ncbi:hypothetical protein N7509_012812 [Penicillium cosmopolitanum]|uniref:Uncharacterized protein n=1 Tax=Penicillium cosmopolitanum TaxID=1131564 RepID=A0A9W9VE04_9EURO|nr:uncharacterized protein N7509_012812 [Penicillium cosmopolitanum]KAJ5375926.1 hypothetical protein N7509_012812 [Penicillium cosmopolitanum]
MTSPQVAKRARANTAGDDHTQLTEISIPTQEQLKILTTDRVVELLQMASMKHADVNAMVLNAIQSAQDERRNRVIDFDYHSKSIWKTINVTYRSMKGSRQYDIAFDVAGEISSTISSIAARCVEFPNPRNRRSGLETLRKIGKTICLSSNDTLGHEVQQQFQSDPCLENAMCDIVSEMSAQEKEDICNEAMGSESLIAKLEELAKLAESCCVFEGIGEVLDLLRGEEVEGGSQDESEEEGYDEDEDEDGHEHGHEHGHENDIY